MALRVVEVHQCVVGVLVREEEGTLVQVFGRSQLFIDLF